MPPVPVHPGGLLADLHDTWSTNGWDLAALGRFRMGPEEEALEALSDDDRTALESLTEENVEQLKKLTAEQLKAITPQAEDPRIKLARTEAADRRRELKPFKELLKKHGVSNAEELEAKLTGKKAPAPKPDDDPDKNKPPVDEDAIRNEARVEADKNANRKVVRSEVKVLARDLFTSPDDAPLYVDLDKYDVDDDGELVDPDELVEDLKKVLVKRPHLAKKPGKPKPDGAQGARGTTATGADAGRAEAEKRFGKQKAKASQ